MTEEKAGEQRENDNDETSEEVWEEAYKLFREKGSVDQGDIEELRRKHKENESS